MQLDDTLNQRGPVHGNFIDSSETYQELLDIMSVAPNWSRMKPAMRRSLSMIIEKMTRILHGQYDFQDHWHDIAGYATLISKELNKND